MPASPFLGRELRAGRGREPPPRQRPVPDHVDGAWRDRKDAPRPPGGGRGVRLLRGRRLVGSAGSPSTTRGSSCRRLPRRSASEGQPGRELGEVIADRLSRKASAHPPRQRRAPAAGDRYRGRADAGHPRPECSSSRVASALQLDGEHVYAVPPLVAEDGVELFVRAGAIALNRGCAGRQRSTSSAAPRSICRSRWSWRPRGRCSSRPSSSSSGSRSGSIC